jgi:hypothetical protein
VPETDTTPCQKPVWSVLGVRYIIAERGDPMASECLRPVWNQVSDFDVGIALRANEVVVRAILLPDDQRRFTFWTWDIRKIGWFYSWVSRSRRNSATETHLHGYERSSTGLRSTLTERWCTALRRRGAWKRGWHDLPSDIPQSYEKTLDFMALLLAQ